MRNLRFSMTLVGVMLVFTGCNIWRLETPVPISPNEESGCELQNDSVLFVWEHVEDATRYNLEIDKDDEFDPPLFSFVTRDTFRLVSCSLFSWGKSYYWRISAYDGKEWGRWSESVNFTFTYDLDFDLDTTYFPFGQGYRWSYERCVKIHTFGHESGDWDTTYYDTFTISVDDSTFDSGVLFIDLEGGGFQDVGRQVQIFVNKLLVFWEDTLDLINPTHSAGPVGSNVNYLEDTLYLFLSYVDPWPGMEYKHYTKRLKKIGVVEQGYSEYGGYPYSYYETDRLLEFRRGGEAVWRRDD